MRGGVPPRVPLRNDSVLATIVAAREVVSSGYDSET